MKNEKLHPYDMSICEGILEEVLQERIRQFREGRTPPEDYKEYPNGELAEVAACLADPARSSETDRKEGIFDLVRLRHAWKRDKEIVVAMTLLAAELERLRANGMPRWPMGLPPGETILRDLGAEWRAIEICEDGEPVAVNVLCQLPTVRKSAKAEELGELKLQRAEAEARVMEIKAQIVKLKTQPGIHKCPA